MRYFKSLLLLTVAVPVLAQNNGYLAVSANPHEAGVFLDGKYLGPAKNLGVTRTFSVPAGTHELRLVDPRYEEVIQQITVESGKKTKVKQKMKPLTPAQPPFGVLRVLHPDKYAAVYINNKYYGHADEFNNFAQGIQLNPGTYDLRVEPASGQPITQKVTIEENKTVIVK
jgi:hypothetical protein